MPLLRAQERRETQRCDDTCSWDLGETHRLVVSSRSRRRESSPRGVSRSRRESSPRGVSRSRVRDGGIPLGGYCTLHSTRVVLPATTPRVHHRRQPSELLSARPRTTCGGVWQRCPGLCSTDPAWVLGLLTPGSHLSCLLSSTRMS